MQRAKTRQHHTSKLLLSMSHVQACKHVSPHNIHFIALPLVSCQYYVLLVQHSMKSHRRKRTYCYAALYASLIFCSTPATSAFTSQRGVANKYDLLVLLQRGSRRIRNAGQECQDTLQCPCSNRQRHI
jgi:hypothetical protein